MSESARAIRSSSEHVEVLSDVVRLTPGTARRIGHQIERTVQGTYGAHDGLRELVHLGTQQMLAQGASREAIRREMMQCMTDRPPTTIATEPARSRFLAEMTKLTTMMVAWADECPAARRTR